MEHLARWCYRHRRFVAAGWALLVVLAVTAAFQYGGEPINDFTVPGTDSQMAVDLLRERFPERSGDTANIVIRAEAGVGEADVRAAVESTLSDIGEVDHVRSVSDPFDAALPAVSADGTIAMASVQLDVAGADVPPAVAGDFDRILDGLRGEGVDVEVGGEALKYAGAQHVGRSEIVGFVAAVVVLLLTFASVVAAGLPILVALSALGVGVALLTLSMNLLDIPDFAPQVAMMIGLGVGVDYALLIVTRYRQGLHGGLLPEDATAIALTTSGRSVMFAGTTVVISMSGMFLMGMPILHGLALGAIVAVVLTMLASITLLPAALGFTGRAIDRLPVGRHRRETGHRRTGWFRWSRLVQRHPWWALASGATVLLVMSVPVLSMRLGSSDDGTEPRSTSARRAYDLIADGFGPGVNGPIAVVVAIPSESLGDSTALDGLVDALAGTDGVLVALPPEFNETGDAAIVAVVPSTSPRSEATDRLFRELRDDVVPAALAGTGITAHLAGITASSIDVAEVVGGRLGIFIGCVLVLSFLLLVVVFRSILVPLKAVLMNLLSIGAAYGLVIAVFQWGWGADLVGIDRTGPILSMVPMWLFAVLFGLSMDYEVFLVTRIQEEYLRTGDNGLAVADGLAVTARVITAAATIMVIVFGSFMLNDDRVLKLFGVGLASAILLDAILVRTLLVPAAMELLDRANWWLPGWLDRILPHVSVEKESELARHVLEEEVVEALGDPPA
ncbi:MAG: MMPL family transporter [Acidimicrobiia bacterium]|nr:MMPL family transporter [Acidimicrobiia bacterium]